MSTQFKEEYITDTESGSSEEASGSEEDVASWISWFCSLKGNEFFCEIEEDYIQDDFNLSGLCSQVNTKRHCLASQKLSAIQVAVMLDLTYFNCMKFVTAHLLNRSRYRIHNLTFASVCHCSNTICKYSCIPEPL